MTKSQINEFLSDLEYDADELIELSEVSSIYTTVDHCLYPDKNTRFKFNSTGNGFLEVYQGKIVNDEFVPMAEFANAYISYDCIGGFTLVGPTHLPQPFKYGLAV